MKLLKPNIASILTLTVSLFAVNHVSALTYQSATDLDFTFLPTLNLTISGNLVIDNLAPGVYSDSNIITVSASSNDVAGYTLYATVGDENNVSTELRRGGIDTTNKFTSITSTKSSLASFDPNANTWGYSYSTDSGVTWISGNYNNSSTGYNGLPLYTNTGIKLAETTSEAGTSSIKFKIGARSANTQAAGSYTNVINFISVGNIVTTAYSLSYIDASNEAIDMPASNTTGSTSNGIFNISSTEPLRTSYIFKGWCTTDNSSDSASCQGNTIYPGGQYTIGSTSASFSGSVYAVWEPIIYIQDYTFATCQTDAVDRNVLVYDKRDNNPYTVRYINGICYMTTDLALGNKYPMQLTQADSNVPASGYTLPASSTEGFSDNSIAYVYNAGPTTCGESSPCHGYYSYVAACAGENPSSSSATCSYDICPAGWRLPTSDEWRPLRNIYWSGAAITASPFFGTYAGGYTDSTFKNGGANGQYRSSTSAGSSGAYVFAYSNSASIMSANKYAGLSIRCIAK